MPHRTLRRTQITYTISGTVTGADGVTVTLSGGCDRQPDGKQRRELLVHRCSRRNLYSDTVEGRIFVHPASQTFSNLAANATQNFAATQITYTISGTVTGADGVTVTLSGGATGSQTVNSGGNYSFTVAAGGTYTVTPSKAGYSFNPASQTSRTWQRMPHRTLRRPRSPIPYQELSQEPMV